MLMTNICDLFGLLRRPAQRSPLKNSSALNSSIYSFKKSRKGVLLFTHSKLERCSCIFDKRTHRKHLHRRNFCEVARRLLAPKADRTGARFSNVKQSADTLATGDKQTRESRRALC